MNSGSSGIVPDDTVTTGTSGMGGVGVEAASCLQPGSPVRLRTSRKLITLNVSLCIRFCIIMFAINRSSEIIRSFRTFTPSRNVHNLIHDTVCQTAGSDKPGPLSMDFLQQIFSI
jgi:hypothetical protein